MNTYKILQYPDPKLKRIAKKVENFEDPQFQKIVDAMFNTHYTAKNCAALAATQLDIDNPPHVTVIDFSPNHDQPLCLVNAEIIENSGEQHEMEGCMSVALGAEIYEKVKRAFKIKIRAQDRHGKVFELEAEEFMAKCIQHELDHLNGKVYLDRLSLLKRDRVEKKIDKYRRFLKARAESEKGADQ